MMHRAELEDFGAVHRFEDMWHAFNSATGELTLRIQWWWLCWHVTQSIMVTTHTGGGLLDEEPVWGIF